LLTTNSFVEYETSGDLETAVAKIDGLDFKGSIVHAIADVYSIQRHRPELR